MRPEETLHTSPEVKQPGDWLRLGAVVLPILKCAVCPACLGIFGSVLAGARIGFLEDERIHGALILVALIADFAILGASIKHHARHGPLGLCAAGALLALAGHFSWEPIEYGGFGVLFAAGIWNLVLLRKHHLVGGSCCTHHHEAAPTAATERSRA